MSDKMRWRYGDTNPVVAAVDADTVIEIGDLVYLDADDAKPARLQADLGTKPLNQEFFTDHFLGVAMQRSRNGETTPIRVATTGVFEYDCASGSFELGNLIGPSENAEGSALLNQQVEKVTPATLAIGRVARREATAATRVLVSLFSSVMTGGMKGMSPAAT